MLGITFNPWASNSSGHAFPPQIIVMLDLFGVLDIVQGGDSSLPAPGRWY